MSRRIPFSAAILIALTAAAISLAEDTRVVISVEKPKANLVEAGKPPFTGQRPAVDVAILLDTSNSMDGLIGQAKNQLWTIVQQFAKAKKNGQTPVLRVALFEYGNTRLPAAEGYIRQVVPLTDDLDKLSESLFALTTSGGDEYCGQVIDEALTRLDWSKEPNSYKAIFIAGNEPFTQGSVDYQKACKRAIEKGVVVNTIHCGARQEGIEGGWRNGAQLAEGEFFNIDQDRAVVQIDCPQDKIIIKLSAELNTTYLWCGTAQDRGRFAANQAAQDANAEGAGAGTASSRGVAKASAAYSNRNRDLVDSLAEDGDILRKLKEQELPEALQQLNAGDREAYVRRMAARRSDIQKQINALAAEREEFLAKEGKRLAGASGDSTFGDAAVLAIRKQLTKSGFENTEEARQGK